MFLTLKLTLLIFVAVSAGEAPGDGAQPFCEQLRSTETAPIPAYSANMRVLMDSWNYQNLLPPRTGAVWDQVDNDENNPSGVTTSWIQQSNTPCQQTVQVCGFHAGAQNNWLITQLINRTVNGTRLPQVSVMIEFEQSGCNTTLNCQRTFNTHEYEASTENSKGAARYVNNYQQVQRVSPVYTSGNRVSNETITINFTTNHSSFYFAIHDETTCMVITRLIIFYTVCPAQTENLIHYPETIAPSCLYEGLPNISISVTCVENAKPENGLAPLVTCSAEGIWASVPAAGAGCHCVPGHFREKINESEICSSCPAGTYLSPSNNSCSTCPANSVSEEEGLAQCTCIEGYYRAPQGEEDLPCTLSAIKSVIHQTWCHQCHVFVDRNVTINQDNTQKSTKAFYTESTSFGKTDLNGPLLENDQKVLLAATLPSALFFAVSLTALVTIAALLHIRANKKDNPAVKSNCDDRPIATKEIEEVYYATVKSSSHDDGPKATKEIEEVYYTTVKSNGDDGSKVTKEIKEVYYSTIDLSTCAVDPQMEKNCAYGDICIHRMTT